MTHPHPPRPRHGAWLAALLALLVTHCADHAAGPDVAEGDTRGEAASTDAPAEDTPEADLPGDAPGVDRLFDVPDDGRLYAAAGAALITPTAGNHPCVQLLGGTGSNRRATGVHDDLEARALVLAQGDLVVVLVALDLVGWLASDVQPVKDALAAGGVDPRHVIVASTHTHSAPDTLGVWGPEIGVSGRCPEYADFVARTVVELVRQLPPRLVPVTAAVAEAPVDFPELLVPSLVNDWRLPEVRNNRLVALHLRGEGGATVATLLNWHAHPEAMIGASEYSADLPRWARLRLEKELGGTAVYVSGTVGGLQTMLDLPVPARTEAGEPVLEGGAPRLVSANDAEKAWSTGHVLAELAVAALGAATTLAGPLAVDVLTAHLPFENPMMILGVASDVIPAQPLIDDPAACGSYGCTPYDFVRVRFGALDLVTLPGEVFPETSVGRAASSHNWGTDDNGAWGLKDYPAIEGYRTALGEGRVLLEVGLANTEIGYLVPESDFVSSSHPGYYEEYFCVSRRAEIVVRESVRALLARP